MVVGEWVYSLDILVGPLPIVCRGGFHIAQLANAHFEFTHRLKLWCAPPDDLWEVF